MKDRREGCRRFALVGAVIVVCAHLAIPNAYPWGSRGHRIINLNAVKQLPGSMAALKADSLFYEAHASDADRRKSSTDTSFFAEYQRHFIDIDAYPDFLHLSHNRDSVIALYGWETVKQNGTLPWATLMVLDSLTAQLKRDDAAAKYTMSDLGHYVADAYQPLHCAVNYNGQLTGNYGIHSRYESDMIDTYWTTIVIHPDSVHYVSAPLDFIFAYIDYSNSLVDSILHADTYAETTSGWNGNGSPPSFYYTALWERTQRLTEDQFQGATVALASLWYTAWINAGGSTSIHEFADVLPEGFRLEQNYPNPFNPVTNFGFRLPAMSGQDRQAGIGDFGFVSLKVYDMLGREVATLVNEVKNPGEYTVRWDGSKSSSGVYFYRLEVTPEVERSSPSAGRVFVQTKRLMILK